MTLSKVRLSLAACSRISVNRISSFNWPPDLGRAFNATSGLKTGDLSHPKLLRDGAASNRFIKAAEFDVRIQE